MHPAHAAPPMRFPLPGPRPSTIKPPQLSPHVLQTGTSSATRASAATASPTPARWSSCGRRRRCGTWRACTPRESPAPAPSSCACTCWVSERWEGLEGLQSPALSSPASRASTAHPLALPSHSSSHLFSHGVPGRKRRGSAAAQGCRPAAAPHAAGVHGCVCWRVGVGGDSCAVRPAQSAAVRTRTDVSPHVPSPPSLLLCRDGGHDSQPVPALPPRARRPLGCVCLF